MVSVEHSALVQLISVGSIGQCYQHNYLPFVQFYRYTVATLIALSYYINVQAKSYARV